MKAYIRYITRHLILPTILITSSIAGILWVVQSLRFVDLIVNRGLSSALFFKLSIMLLPSLVLVILPVALFCAVLYAYNRFMNDSELIALKASGIGDWQLVRPALYVGVFFTLIGYFISFYLMPLSFRNFKDMQYHIRNHYASVLLQEGVFNTLAQGWVIYVHEKQQDHLKGIFVHDTRKDHQYTITLMAEEGTLERSSTGPKFILKHGNMQRINAESHDISLLHFDSYVLDVSVDQNDQKKRLREPKERYLWELFFAKEASIQGRKRQQLHAEGHHRITWPLYNTILALIAATVLVVGEYNRRGLWLRVVFANVIVLGIVFISFVCTGFASTRGSLIFLMYLNVLVGFFITYLLLKFNRRLDTTLAMIRYRLSRLLLRLVSIKKTLHDE